MTCALHHREGPGYDLHRSTAHGLVRRSFNTERVNPFFFYPIFGPRSMIFPVAIDFGGACTLTPQPTRANSLEHSRSGDRQIIRRHRQLTAFNNASRSQYYTRYLR